MNIKMTQSAFGSANSSGNETTEYKEGKTYSMNEPWQEAIAQAFLDAEFCIEVKVVEPKKKVAKKKTAKKK